MEIGIITRDSPSDDVSAAQQESFAKVWDGLSVTRNVGAQEPDHLHGTAERSSTSSDADALRQHLIAVTAQNEQLALEMEEWDKRLRTRIAERDDLAEQLAAARNRNGMLAKERDVAEEFCRQLEAQLSALNAEREVIVKEVDATRRLVTRLETRLRRAGSERDLAVAESGALSDALIALQRQAQEVAEDAATLRERSTHLERELGCADARLRGQWDELIAAHDQHEQLGCELEQLRSELAEAQHRVLVQTDGAWGFLESLRSVAEDDHPDRSLHSLDEAQLLEWARRTREDRLQLRAANDALLTELAAVNRHRAELLGYLSSIWSCESWKIGRALTWPVRALRRRPADPGTADRFDGAHQETVLPEDAT